VCSLSEIKVAIASLKKKKIDNCDIHFYDPRRFARASAQLAKQRADASSSAAEAAIEAVKAAEKAQFLLEEEARELAELNERWRQQAMEEARVLAQEHERQRLEARQKAEMIAAENKRARDAAEEEARQFEARSQEAQERARIEAQRLIDEENVRKAEEAQAIAHGEMLAENVAVASRAVHEIVMHEIETGKIETQVRNSAKEEAFGWWQKSSALGCLDASNDLAMCLAYGDGCETDTVRARKVWEDAINRGHAPSMHNCAMAFIKRTGIILRFMGGGPGNMERATELLVAAAKKGYQPSIDFLYESQPLCFRTLDDFEPKSMPPMKFADTIVGRRVQVYGYKFEDKRYELNNMYGTVESIKPAAGKFMVRLEDYSLVSFSRNHIQRPFVASLSEDLIKVPPPPPTEISISINPKLSLGIDLESDTLLVTKVDPKSQTWEQGIRPGFILAYIAGIRVKDLEHASIELKESKGRKDKTCQVIFHVLENRPKGFF